MNYKLNNMGSRICMNQSIKDRTLQFRYIITLFFICLLLIPAEGFCRKQMEMYVGEVRVLKLDKIDKVAIGNPKVASNSILNNGQMIVLADTVGITTMHIWLQDGKEKVFDILVREKADMDSYRDLSKLVSHMPGVSVSKIDDILVVNGKISKTEQKQLTAVLAKYKDALNLATIQDAEKVVHQLLQDVPNVQIKEVDDYVVVFGEVDEEYSALIGKVAAKYPQLLDLTRVQDAVVDKMIYMRVKVMEVNKKVTENLGINWNVSKILGPSLEFGVETSRNGGTILNAENTSKVMTAPGGANLNTARGFFGIASGITSLINLAETSGDAVVLAEPQLSTRSGGKAEFLAGGEYPMPVTSSMGQTTVKFKKYGILLDIEPVVDDLGNILAHVKTEISTIDSTIVVDGLPGLLTRSTSTDVSLRPKQTLVIAGLVQDLANKGYDKVKWLADLPVLGPLFRSKDFSNQRSELVIFVTPYVYDVGSEINIQANNKAEMIQATFDTIIEGNELLE